MDFLSKYKFINPSIYNILRWVAWTIGQTNRRTRVWCSKYHFFNTFYRLRALKTLYFYFCNFIKKNKKINWKDFCKEFCKKSWKKIILGTSDAWSTIRLSHHPSDPAYYIVNWRISNWILWFTFHCVYTYEFRRFNKSPGFDSGLWVKRTQWNE